MSGGILQRHCIIIPAALQQEANEAAFVLGIDPEGVMNTFTVGLVPMSGAGDAAVTHYLACGRVTEGQRQWLESNQGLFPGARWWRWVDAGPEIGQLMASDDGLLIGEAFSVQRCLEIVNLKRQFINL